MADYVEIRDASCDLVLGIVQRLSEFGSDIVILGRYRYGDDPCHRYARCHRDELETHFSIRGERSYDRCNL